MFMDISFKKYKIDENNSTIGEFEVNMELMKHTEFARPFIRDNNRRVITKIGNRNYEELNNYIINCMKNYYNRLVNAAATDYDMMLKTYNRLYDMWKELHMHKNNNNLVEMDKMYDLFSYELYVLGYTN